MHSKPRLTPALFLAAALGAVGPAAWADQGLYQALAGKELHLRVAADSDLGDRRAPESIVRLFASGAGQAINGREKQWLVWDFRRGAFCIRGAFMFEDMKIRPVGRRECGSLTITGDRIRLERQIDGKREAMEGQILPLPPA